MKVRNFNKVEKRGAFLKEKSAGVSFRVAISEEDGAEHLTMRFLEIDPEGFTPMHSHNYEDAMLVVRGQGIITDGKKECRLEKDDVVFVKSDQNHQIKNTGDSELIVVSIVPIGTD